MAPRAREQSLRPRRLADVVVRPLNFTVRGAMRTATTALAAFTLGSCAVVSHDVTHKPVASQIAGRCFYLAQDTYVINKGGIGVRDILYVPQGRCRAQDGTLSSLCPQTLEQVKAHIPRGTSLRITDVINHAEGESGRCWLVLAQLDAASGVNHSVEIPSCTFARGNENWLTSWNPDNTVDLIAFKPERLAPCGSAP